MPINASRLSKWFAISGTLLLLVVIGFYSYARYRVRRAIKEIPAKLGVNIQQSTSGFTFSKSEGGRTLFSITAGKAVQFKQGERAKLNDVRIIVYGRSGTDRYDQIYGKEFDYDPNSGDVTAGGEVDIDLDATGKPSASVESSQNSPRIIHVRTSALTFNQNTGIAQTSQAIDFAMPQGSGSAVGAHYETKSMSLTLLKDVRVHTSPPAKSKIAGKADQAAEILADNAVITDEPRQALLKRARVEQKNQKFSADEVTIYLRADNSVSEVKAAGNVRSSSGGKSSNEVHSKTATFTFGDNNILSSLMLDGDVSLQQTGSASSSMNGTAGRVLATFTGKNELRKVRASEHVHMIQTNAPERPASQSAAPQTTKIDADAIDFYFTPGRQLQRAETSGFAQLELNSTPAAAASSPAQRLGAPTVLTAGRFDMSFAAHNRIKSLFGSPNVRVVSSTEGQPDRVSTSRDFTATFDPAHNDTLARVTQAGDVRYNDGPRTASGDSADYTPNDETVTLSGTPRFQDKDSGLTLTAQRLRMNRSGQDLSADGDVKTTYEATKRGAPSSSAGLFNSQGGGAVHVTADKMTYNKSSGIARYTSNKPAGARLWQGADVIQAPVIVFDQKNNTLLASRNDTSQQKPNQSQDMQPVRLSFAKANKNGQLVPVTATGVRLSYSEKDRQVKLEGPTEMRMPDATLSANRVELFLRAKNASSAAPSQIDRAIAHQDVLIAQKNPARKATGETLIYTAADEKFVLTGTPEKPPSIFDAEHGNVTGDSLTFYNRDDRVQVGGSDSSRTVTRTRVKSESKP